MGSLSLHRHFWLTEAEIDEAAPRQPHMSGTHWQSVIPQLSQNMESKAETSQDGEHAA